MNNRYDEVTASIFFVLPVQFFLMLMLGIALIFNLRELVLFSLFLLISGFLTYLWSLASLINVQCSFKPDRTRIFPGSCLKIFLTLNNSKLLPVVLKFNFYIPDSMAPDSSDNNPTINDEKNFIWFQKSKSVIEIYPQKRGVYSLGPPVLRGSDIFGLYHKTGTAGEQTEILVYPRAAKIRNMDIIKKDYFGKKAGRSPVADPLYIKGTRDYQPGGAARDIHWKASARHNRLQEKVFESVEKEKILIILDAGSFADASAEAEDNLNFETILEVITAFLLKLPHTGTAAGFITNGRLKGKGSAVFPVSGNKNQTAAVLETLARLQPVKNKDIREMLTETVALSYGTSCLYFTASITQETLSAALLLKNRKIPCSFFITDKSAESGNDLIKKNTVYIDNIISGREQTA